MKLSYLCESALPRPGEEPLITPTYNWRKLGDGSFVLRVEYTPEKVFVHSNKNRSFLEKLIKDRYGPKRFVM